MAREVKEYTCIVCPMGCPLKVELEDGKVLKVTGNTCPRGEKYAITESTAPRRVLTSTVRVTGGHLPLCPVRTKGTSRRKSSSTRWRKSTPCASKPPSRSGTC